MPKVYSIVYLANREPNTTTSAIHNSEPVKDYYFPNRRKKGLPVNASALKIDMGDDPSLLAYVADLGPLTWGTCRTTTRNSISIDDYIVFFAREINKDNDQHQYFLTGYARVAEKVTQVSFLTGKDQDGKTINNQANKPNEYANLLIQKKPKCSKKYEWSEWPGIPNNKIYSSILNELKKNKKNITSNATAKFVVNFKDYCWHPDWCRRICSSEGRTVFSDGTAKVDLAKNYIIFDDIHILKTPILVVSDVDFTKELHEGITWDKPTIKELTHPVIAAKVANTETGQKKVAGKDGLIVNSGKKHSVAVNEFDICDLWKILTENGAKEDIFIKPQPENNPCADGSTQA